MKLFKNNLFLSLILFNATSFIAAQDDTANIKNNEKSTVNPLESLYTQYKELGTIAIDPENLENIIALLKEDIAQLEQQKSSLQNKPFIYRTIATVSTTLTTIDLLVNLLIHILSITNDITYNKMEPLQAYKNYWYELFHGIKNMQQGFINVAISQLLALTGIFTAYTYFKKANQTIETKQKIKKNIILDQTILSKLKKNYTRISNETN